MNIYVITNKINNKQYVGLTTKSIYERFKNHIYNATCGGGYYLHKAMNKYGIENFKVELIENSATNIEELKQQEIFHIQRLDTYNNGYNLTKGGDFSANDGHVIVLDKYDNISRVSISEFAERDDLISINKNKITIYKGDSKLRVSTLEYKEIYFELGYRSKNFGYTTVILTDGTKTKIKCEDFDKSIHNGINKNKQLYFNSIQNKFELLTSDLVDLNIHYSKYKTKYVVYDNDNNRIDSSLCITNISIEHGRKQFEYALRRNKYTQEIIITLELLEKLKFKSRNYNLIGYKLIIERL